MKCDQSCDPLSVLWEAEKHLCASLAAELCLELNTQGLPGTCAEGIKALLRLAGSQVVTGVEDAGRVGEHRYSHLKGLQASGSDGSICMVWRASMGWGLGNI